MNIPDIKIPKIIRDPVHDLIRVDDVSTILLIDSIPMQRLRRIRQLGLAYLVFPGAEHSRFVHSLGVFHLAHQVLAEFDRSKRAGSDQPYFEPNLKRVLVLAALLHDLGHGPFSHQFERVARKVIGSKASKHIDWTIKILKEDSEIAEIMRHIGNEIGLDVTETIIDILSKTYKPNYVVGLIDSQLDVDQFDYLLRDCLMTGAKYGTFDLAWLLHSLRIGTSIVAENPDETEEVIAVESRRGLNAVEMHLLGRHYMYKNVYYHRTVRAAEAMLQAIITCAVDLVRKGKIKAPHPVIESFANNKEPSLKDYLSLDDFVVLTWVELWSTCEDKTLKDLSDRPLRRKIFKTIPIPASTAESRNYYSRRHEIDQLLVADGFDPEYYLLEDDPSDIAYKVDPIHYKAIYYLDEQMHAWSLSKYPGFLTEAKDALKFSELRWYVPDTTTKDRIMKLISR